MNLDNDRNPIAPHHPSDPPPRRPAGQGEGFAQTEAGGVAAPVRSPADAPSQDTDASDATSSRAVVRSILAALPLDVRAAVVAAVLAWCRSLAAVAGMVGRRELGAVEALPLTDAATVTLMERDGAAPHDVVAAMLGAWWAAGPYDLARQVSRGTTSAGDFADALAFLVQLQGDADALAYVTSAAPRIVRCPLPAGVDRVTMRGDTFLPAELPPALTRGALDALARDAARVLAAVDPRGDRDTDVAELVLRAQRGALAVMAGDGPVCSAAVLAGLGGALVDLAAHEAAAVEGPPAALDVADRAAAVAALAELAARAFGAVEAVCSAAVDRGDRATVDTRWP